MNAHRPIHSARAGSGTCAGSKAPCGTIDRSATCLYVPGEGWVRWTEIYLQVDAAFNRCLMRWALAGKYIADGFERDEAQIRAMQQANLRKHLRDHQYSRQ